MTTKKKPTASRKPKQVAPVEKFEPNKVGFMVATVAAVSLVLFGLMAVVN